MTKISLDARIRDDGLDALRRSLYESRENQAHDKGYAKGHADGLAEGLELGYKRAVEDYLSLALDFAKGNRTW